MPKHTKRKLKKTRARRRTLRGGNSVKESVKDLSERLKKAESSLFQKTFIAKTFGLENKGGLHTFLSKLNDITDETRNAVNDYIKEINSTNKNSLIFELLKYETFNDEEKEKLNNLLY